MAGFLESALFAAGSEEPAFFMAGSGESAFSMAGFPESATPWLSRGEVAEAGPPSVSRLQR